MAVAFGVRPETIEDDSLLMHRILDTIQGGSKGNTLYKPRANGGVNKNQSKYSAEQLQYIMDGLEEELNFFGYTDTDPNNPYAFFKYGEQSKESCR